MAGTARAAPGEGPLDDRDAAKHLDPAPMVRHGGAQVASIYRVQYRRAGWQPTTSTKTRIFARETDAWRFAARVHASGGVAIVATAARGPWIVAEAGS